MSFVNISKSVLLKTSAATDVNAIAGQLLITGLNPIRKSTILDFKQIMAKTEVVQVYTAGGGSYTPTASTTYQVLIGDPNADRQGYTGTVLPYAYTTPAVLTSIGATAALQREYIHVQIVAAINADVRNYVVAATLGTGTGFTITDDAGYYPANINGGSGGRLGASFVQLTTNADGSGWSASNLTLTTAAVYSFGQGTRMAQDQPILAAYTQLLASGTLDVLVAPVAADGTYATAGQKYNAFYISSLSRAAANSIIGQIAYMPLSQAVFVDNGLGSATTNAAGYIAFEREILRALFGCYAQDPSAAVDFFDSALIASATYPTTGAAISTTDNVVMSVSDDSGVWYVNPIGTHTLLTPLVTTAGLTPYLDVTTQEGIEFSTPNLTQNPREFVVGKTEMSFYTRVTFGGIGATDWKTLSVGFRKKAAYAVDQTAYEAASVATACLGVPIDTGAAPVINMITGPGSAGALTNTSCAVSPTAAQTVELLVTVDINGVTKFYVNGVDKTPLLAASYTFTAGLHLMPFISFRHGAGTAAAPAVVAAVAVPSATWRL
jgi:hypothetical protein